MKAKWFEGMKAEDLPGDMAMIAEMCGMEVAILLSEKLPKQAVYIRPMDSVLEKKRKEYVLANFKGNNHAELALVVGVAKRTIYRWLDEKKEDDRQNSLFAS
ncbi:MAG: hypothetical protein M0Z52_03885 [Actinomycetota bacterium]|nr:hypothetical protein [Actinomycetota bacterium]